MVEVPNEVKTGLNTVFEQLQAIDTGDLPGLVAVADALGEASLALEALPLPAALSASQACSFAAQTAHRIVLDEVEDNNGAFALLRQAISEVAACLAADCREPISAELLTKIAATAGAEVVPESAATSAAAQDVVVQSSNAGTGAADSIETLDDAAMVLVGISPDDTASLGRIADGLAHLLEANQDDWPELSQASVKMAIELSKRMESGKSGCGNAQLTEIGRLLEAAQEAIDGFAPAEAGGGDGGKPSETAASASASSSAASTGKSPVVAEKFDRDALAAEVIEALSSADGELMGEFLTENLDHLEQAEGSLLTLERDAHDSESLNAVFRAFHTIKGTSGFLGLGVVQRVAHLSETLLDRCRTGKITLTGGYADLALESCDCLKLLMSQIQGHMSGGTFEVPERVISLMQVLSDPEGAGYDSESTPEEAEVRVGDILVAQGKVTREQVEQAVGRQGNNPLGKTLVHEKAVSARDVASALRVQNRMTGGEGGESLSVKVRLERLDSLINMVGELVIAHSLVAQDDAVSQSGTARLSRNVSHMGKITRELQDLSMSLRMVPLKGTFQKMVRLVRDLSQKSGKKVQFVTEGDDTEIDRNMVEIINDPLVHMIRNSVDHGIEPPQKRAESGKEAMGRVSLRAYHSAGSVVLELKDDGRGLDRQKIVAKAIDRGLIETDAGMSEAEVFDLIFRPGFSTAEKVTDVSGRGVGMDVVKRGVEALRGKIEVSSTLGRGTTFTVRLPLTLAIIDGMVVEVGGQRYIIPMSNIRTTFRPQSDQISVVTERGEMVNFHNQMLPVFRTYKVFGIEQAQTNPTEGLLLVVDDDGRQAAVLVDDLVGQQQVVVKSLGGGLGEVQALSGGAIMGDGRVGLIIDVQGFMQLARGQSNVQKEELELSCSAAEA